MTTIYIRKLDRRFRKRIEHHEFSVEEMRAL